MKFILATLATLAAALLAVSALPARAADPGTIAIEAIGRINGMALACEQPAIASRARNAVTTTAPKTRANGETFENATNAAYLEQGKGAPCPDTAGLNAALGDAEKKLQAAFPASR